MNKAPWDDGLPEALTVGGEERPIRTDYRVALDCFLALADNDLDAENKLLEVLDCLYVDEVPPEYMQEALEKAFWYLRGGEEERSNKKSPQLVSWAQDFNLIASPISKDLGRDIRGIEHYHWWSFLSAYMSIGDCLFAQVVSIRSKLASGKSLDKSDREFYRKNKDIIDIKQKMTNAETALVDEWM